MPPTSDPDSRVGEIVDDRYRILEHLATGGMASIYRAQHLHNAGVVAIKILHAELATNAEVSARFRREALAARCIRHPHVVSIWDVGRLADGCCFMVLEYIPGKDLWSALHAEKPFEQARAARIASQVADAVGSAHAAGVIHRDLKPDNIMLLLRDGDPDYVKVVDFGIAKVKARGAPLLTAIGSVFGTPEYMAPEQARGATVDHRSDLYALGTVLYEMLTGAAPFAHEDFGEVLMGQISRPPRPLPARIDAELAALVMTLLAKDPERRPQTALEVRDRLRAIVERLTPTARPLAQLPPMRPPPQAPVDSRPGPATRSEPVELAAADSRPGPATRSEPVELAGACGSIAPRECGEDVPQSVRARGKTATLGCLLLAAAAVLLALLLVFVVRAV